MSSIPERSFDKTADQRRPTVITDRASADSTTEEGDNLRTQQMRDPRVQARIKQIFEDAGKGESGPGITAEELPDFLREHG